VSRELRGVGVKKGKIIHIMGVIGRDLKGSKSGGKGWEMNIHPRKGGEKQFGGEDLRGETKREIKKGSPFFEGEKKKLWGDKLRKRENLPWRITSGGGGTGSIKKRKKCGITKNGEKTR